MKSIKVSICCVTYNHLPYIERCLEGFVSQKTDFPFEILVHDDASTDGTTQIVKEFENSHPHLFRNVYQTVNQFQIQNTLANILFRNAKGDYIALCEGDDYWTDPFKLQKQVDFLENNPEFILTSGNVIDIIEPNKEVVHHPIVEGEFSFDELVKKSYVSTLTAVFRNISFPADFWNYVSRIHAGDYPLYFMLLQHGKLKVFPDIFGCYRRHSQGVFSQKSFIESHELAIQSNKIIIEYHKLKGWKYKALYASIGRSNYYCLENALEIGHKANIKKYLLGLLLKTPYTLDFSKKIILKSLVFLVFSKGKK